MRDYCISTNNVSQDYNCIDFICATSTSTRDGTASAVEQKEREDSGLHMAENRWRYNQGLAPYLFLLATLYALSAGQCIYYARILDDGPRVCVKDPKGINEWWCRSGEDALLLLDEAARTAHHSVPRYFYTKYNVIIWNSKCSQSATYRGDREIGMF